MDRIIFLGMQVEENIANIITAQLLFLESVDAKKDILLYINSPGGSVYAGLGNISVKEKEKVSRSQIIGNIRSGDPSFLHFEVRRGFESIDPMEFFN